MLGVAETVPRGCLATAITDLRFGDGVLRGDTRHLEGVRRHVMDHLTGLDLAKFAEAVGNMAAGEPGPPVRRTGP
jgi:hypothetical protein